MPVSMKPNGEFTVVYAGPYGGFHTMLPENLLPDNFSPATNDFWFRNAELSSRPVFGGGTTAPVALAKVLAVGSLGSKLWAVSSGNGLYSSINNGNTWTLVPGSATVGGGNTVWKILGGVLYITGGGSLSSWDGTTFTLNNASVSGTNVGGIFLDELDNHILLADTAEGATIFGNRLRWSATSLPNVWDPAVNVNAGFQDFLDVPDGITGLMMLGRVGYIFRTDGITEAAPTGRGAAPFEFNHLWASQRGIGNVKFFCYDQYGTTGVIVARDNIYSIMSYNVQPIGGGARDQILTDMSSASACVGGAGGTANIFGVIVPYLSSGLVPDAIQTTNLGGGVTAIYMAFMLFLNIGNNCKVWIYDFDQQNWTNWTLPGFNITGKPSLANIVGGTQILYIPRINTNSSATDIGTFTPARAGNDNQACSHSFKVEDIVPNMVPTIRRVILTYRDLGLTTVTITIAGTNDNGGAVTVSQTKTIGTAPFGTGTLKTAFFEPVDANGRVFTGFRPQLTISRASGAGPLSISTTTMIGKVDMENL